MMKEYVSRSSNSPSLLHSHACHRKRPSKRFSLIPSILAPSPPEPEPEMPRDVFTNPLFESEEEPDIMGLVVASLTNRFAPTYHCCRSSIQPSRPPSTPPRRSRVRRLSLAVGRRSLSATSPSRSLRPTSSRSRPGPIPRPPCEPIPYWHALY